ncbi:MAG: pyridoxamine 5'-phosphate oxidase family protein [Caldiserica bacterium]|nr:pyridoxamine 5'-phosphate oxidase family protein [Caldisericota bacterium]
MDYELRIQPDREKPEAADIVWGNRTLSLPLVPLPGAFLEWQLRFRRANIRFFMTGEGEHDFAVHVGYMGTVNHDGPCPVNIAAKGVGLLLRRDLDDLGAEIEALIEEGLARGEEETRGKRLSFLLKLYEEVELDPYSFATIEIFARTTWRNITRDPRCSVLFASYRNTSFLINGVAEVLGPGTPEYRFVTGLHDLFHLPRSGKRRGYPAVYRIWAVEAYDKTPGPRAGERLA